MADKFESFAGGLDSPATGGQVVVADAAFGTTSRALYVGTQGDLTVVMKDGQSLPYKSYQGWLPARATMVLAAGLTAADILAVW